MDKQKIQQNKKTVIVLGVARSGTSTVAGILSILGVNMSGSRTSLPVVPKGNYEDPEIHQLINKILEKSLSWNSSMYWDRVELFYSRSKVLEQKNNFDRQIKDIILQKEQNNTIWGWKYPATHLVIDFFLPYLSNLYFVVCFRNPLKVAKSSQEFFSLMNIQKKVGLFQMLKAVNFHNRIILDLLEKHPELPRIFIAFENIINNPSKEAKRLADFLGLELTNEKRKKIKKFVIPRDKIKREKRKAYFRNKLRTSLFGKGLIVLKKRGMVVFLNKLFKLSQREFSERVKFLQQIFLAYYISRIHHFHSNKIENLINFSFCKLGKVIKPQQIPEEISELLKILEKENQK